MSDNKKSEKPKGQPREKKNEDHPKKSDAPKHDNEDKEKKTHHKDDKNHEEKKHGDGHHYKRRGPKEKLNVTLDTKIPELPKKEDRIQKPDDEALDRELDKFSKLIDEQYKKMNDIAREANNKDYQPTDKGRGDLTNLLRAKNKEKNEAYSAFQEANTEKEQYRKQLEEYYEKSNELRFKMRRAGRKDELESELRQLKLKQSSGTISLQEEKLIIKEISELERSLPFAEPLEQLDEQFKDVKEALKKAKKEASAKYEVLSRLKEEVRDIQDQIDKYDEETEKKKKDSTPAIQKMKDEYRAKIDEFKNKKKDLIKQNKEAWDKYYDQQDEIDRIQKMHKIKQRLIRDEERRKRQEEWEKKQKEREEEMREIPYVQEIELCDQLIQYCARMLPKIEEDNSAALSKNKEEAIKQALASNDWKKDKVTELKSKKEQDNDFFTGKKKDKKAKPQEKKEEDNSHAPLNHQFETLNFFESIKVSPPLFINKIDDTIKVLNEKKAYFQKLQDDAVKSAEDKKTAPAEAEGEKKAEEKTEEKPKNERGQKKKKEGKQNLDLENETEFPKFSQTLCC